MKIRHVHWFVTIGTIALTLVLAVACSKEKVTGPKEEPPTIPPKESFVMDFSDFQTKGSLAKGEETLTKDNWGWAALNVGVWNTLITIGMAVPAAAFVESFHHNPVQQEDGTWVWNYHFTVLGVQHTASLHGKMLSDGVKWEMYISKENFYQDFLWYSGKSDFLATEGTWTIFHQPDDPTPWIGILWHRNPQAGTADIQYKNIVPNGPENGGYIFYGIKAETPFDAFYDIYNQGKDNHTRIEWNRATKDGRVKDPMHFGDTEWHCWDSTLEDTTCQ